MASVIKVSAKQLVGMSLDKTIIVTYQNEIVGVVTPLQQAVSFPRGSDNEEIAKAWQEAQPFPQVSA